MNNDKQVENNNGTCKTLGYEECRPHVRRAKTFDSAKGQPQGSLMHVPAASRTEMKDESADDAKNRRRRNRRRGNNVPNGGTPAEEPPEPLKSPPARRRSFSGLIASVMDASLTGSSSRRQCDDKGAMEDHSARLESNRESSSYGRRAGRRSKETSTVHANVGEEPQDAGQSPKPPPRRKSFSGLLSSIMDTSLSGSSNSSRHRLDDKRMAMEDRSSRVDSSCRTGRRHTSRSNSNDETTLGSSISRLSMAMPFKSHSSDSNNNHHHHHHGSSSSNRRRDKKRPTNDKEKSPEQLLEEMEELAKIVHENPEKLKMLQAHLQKHSPAGFVRVG